MESFVVECSVVESFVVESFVVECSVVESSASFGTGFGMDPGLKAGALSFWKSG